MYSLLPRIKTHPIVMVEMRLHGIDVRLKAQHLVLDPGVLALQFSYFRLQAHQLFATAAAVAAIASTPAATRTGNPDR